MKVLNLLRITINSYYLKQLMLRIKFRGRLFCKGYRLMWEEKAEFTIDSTSKIYLGKFTHLRKGADIEALDGAAITIGDNFFMNKNSSIIARYGITIGSNCMIGDSTMIIDHNHTFSDANTSFKSQGYTGSPISIGDNVWIAGRVFIGKGVHIGNNVVIGSNTVVTKSIPSNSIVYGKTELIIKPLWEVCQ